MTLKDDLLHFEQTLQRVPQFNELTIETQQAIDASASHHHFETGQVIDLLLPGRRKMLEAWHATG